MSPLSNRRLIRALIFWSILLPFISFSQVTIKEKVEIKPKARLSSSPATELKVVFYWSARKSAEGSTEPIHLGILEPSGQIRGFDVLSGTTSSDYSEEITYVGENSYGGETVYTNSDPQPGLYFLYAIADTSTEIIPMWGPYWVDVYIGGQLDKTIIFERFGWGVVPDTRYRVNTLMYTLIGEPSGPCTGAHFVFSEIEDLQHGETRYIHAPILDDCGNNVDQPPEYYYKFELLGDTLAWGVLRDVNTGKTGTVLDSVASTIIEFLAWGKEPEAPKQLTVRVSAENGSISPALATFTVLPPEVHVLAGKTTISYGDTTRLTMEVRFPGGLWMNKPDDWSARYGITQGDTFGFLYTLDSSQIGSYFDGWDPAMLYYADPETEADSVEVLIQLVSQEPGGIATSIRSLNLPGKTTQKQLSSMKAPQFKLSTGGSRRESGLTSIRYSYDTHYGLARLVLKRYEILLGETRYYYVLEHSDGTKTIEWTTDPRSNPGVKSDVWQSNAVVPVIDKPKSGKRLGVYWEKDKPIPDRTKNLPVGMIRLVGRFWHADSIYKVNLTATHNGTLNNIIEVKRPDKLLKPPQSPDYAKVKNVFADPNEGNPNLDLDALIIRYAGENGIPPQIIKGQMLHETTFKPAWRYEPFSDVTYQYQTNAKDYFGKDMPFVVNETSMGTGDWPSEHTNVSPTPYVSTPIKIAKFTTDHWGRYVRHETGKNPDRIIGNKGLTDRWNELYQKAKEDKKLSDEKAREQAHTKLKDELLDVNTDLGERYDIVAQTRKVTSYGFIQMMYITAASPPDNKYSIETDGRYKATGTNYVDQNDTHMFPEKLNEEAFLMPIYCDRLLRKMKQLKFKSAARIPSFNWLDGFEETWRATLQDYNSGETDYGKNVLIEAQKFLPSQ